jgi:hypothetical protein
MLTRTSWKPGANPLSLLCPLLAKHKREPVGKAKMWFAVSASLDRMEGDGLGAERQ